MVNLLPFGFFAEGHHVKPEPNFCLVVERFSPISLVVNDELCMGNQPVEPIGVGNRLEATKKFINEVDHGMGLVILN